MVDLIDDAVTELNDVPVPISWADVQRRVEPPRAPMADLTIAAAEQEQEQVPRSRRGRARWAAAAAAVALVGGGAWFVVEPDDVQQVATSHSTAPSGSIAVAETTVPAPSVPAAPNAGIWRLPERLGDDLRVLRASTSTTWFAFELAVDDPSAPTRWIGVLPGDRGYFEDAESPVASGTFANGSTYAFFEPRPGSATGSTWADLDGPDGAGAGAVTVAAAGVDHQEIIDVLAQIAERAPDLDIDGVLGSLGELALPEGLQAAWSPILPGTAAAAAARPTQLQLQVDSVDVGEFSFAATYTGLPPAVAALSAQIQREAHNEGHGMSGHVVTRRDDLGLGTLVSEMLGGQLSLTLFTDDGVILSAGEFANDGDPMGLGELVDLVGRFQVVPESELRARLTDAGIRIVDGDQLPTGAGPATTTTVPGPAGTG